MFDEIAFITLVSCIAVYRLLYRYRCKNPESCMRTVIDELHESWVDARLKEENPITAVQALRNMLMACSIFITSTLILLGLLVGALAPFLSDDTPFLGIQAITAGTIKSGTIVAAVFVSAFCFIMAARLATRASMLVTAKPGSVDLGDELSGIHVTRTTFKSMQKYWMLGVRSMLYMLAAVAWLVSPFLFMTLVIVMTVYLIWFQDVWSAKK